MGEGKIGPREGGGDIEEEGGEMREARMEAWLRGMREIEERDETVRERQMGRSRMRWAATFVVGPENVVVEPGRKGKIII